MKRISKVLWGRGILVAFVARASISLGLATLGVLASPGAPRSATTGRTVPVTMRSQSGSGVLTVTAITPVKGTEIADRWSISPSLVLATMSPPETPVGDETARVSSVRVAEAALLPDTTYTFSYSIVMKTGEDAWSGGGSVAITVGSDGSIR